LECTAGAVGLLLIFELSVVVGNVGWLCAGGERPTNVFAESGEGTDGNLDTVDDQAAGACGADSEGTGSRVGW